MIGDDFVKLAKQILTQTPFSWHYRNKFPSNCLYRHKHDQGEAIVPHPLAASFLFRTSTELFISLIFLWFFFFFFLRTYNIYVYKNPFDTSTPVWYDLLSLVKCISSEIKANTLSLSSYFREFFLFCFSQRKNTTRTLRNARPENAKRYVSKSSVVFRGAPLLHTFCF